MRRLRYYFRRVRETEIPCVTYAPQDRANAHEVEVLRATPRLLAQGQDSMRRVLCMRHGVEPMRVRPRCHARDQGAMYDVHDTKWRRHAENRGAPCETKTACTMYAVNEPKPPVPSKPRNKHARLMGWRLPGNCRIYLSLVRGLRSARPSRSAVHSIVRSRSVVYHRVLPSPLNVGELVWT